MTTDISHWAKGQSGNSEFQERDRNEKQRTHRNKKDRGKLQQISNYIKYKWSKRNNSNTETDNKFKKNITVCCEKDLNPTVTQVRLEVNDWQMT